MTVTTDAGTRARSGPERLLAALRANMLAFQPGVAEAFLAVPRHLFLPAFAEDQAYRDRPFVTKHGADGVPLSSSAQPSTMAMMLDLLGLRPGMRVLEIGAGTGYNAALMSHIVTPLGKVVTIEFDGEVASCASRNLASAGFDQVTVLHADGAAGSQEHAPYDRIMVTAGAADLPPAWYDQLADGGRIVVPLTLRIAQRVVAFEKDSAADGILRSVAVRDCGFMGGFTCLAGDCPGAEITLGLPGRPGVYLRTAGDIGADLDVVSRALDDPPVTIHSGVRVTLADAVRGLGLWLALTEPRLVSLFADSTAAENGAVVPPLLAFPGHRGTTGLGGPGGIAVLAPGQADGAEFDLLITAIGTDAGVVAAELADHIQAWDAAGRPSTTGLRINAYPPGHPGAQWHEFVIDKEHVRLGLSWQWPGRA